MSPLDKNCRLTYPLKPSYAGEPGHIPLVEIDSGTCFKVEVCKALVRPKGSEFTLLDQPPAAFHETGFRL